MIDSTLPLWIAHRGAGRLAPENTLAAFRLGAAHGFRAFECDVKLSADGVPFLLHDDTLERTSDRRGIAGDLPWSTLSRVDAGSWLGPAWAGETLPTLAAIARWVIANGHGLNLEIKPTTGLERETGLAVGRACAELWRGAATPLLLSSFQPDALEGARTAAPGIARALLLDRLGPGWFDIAQGLACVAVVTHHRWMDAALLARLHAAGLRALCYTVNEPADVRRLLALGKAGIDGIDGIITDAVDRYPAAALA
ncbi:MAG: glycerophosphodiester phosphodiesterase [Burkholderiales bacterium]|nr:glycerophosphodiester phosphodiesterase [Burkholderiales bacterium]MDE1926002.1 glycerophosphodiester phosphodiesterase [Burkholderiales bacterium]MDE2160229.1 glycerophosphodiester phosphodiesterase [Burkholderiales bacterium]